MPRPDWEQLIEGVKKKSPRALARLITRVENREDGWEQAMAGLYPDSGRARIIGITGSPGAGKSTLTNACAKEMVEQGLSVGIIAVDPSSPFSGGALLGDRLRMAEIVTHPDVFIRSMATRGALGGLCQGARDVARALDAFGKDVVIIETVGVGQDEVEVVKAADLVAVVCVPGQGDGIQALKAGIMEIADVYVVNKADRPGADEVVADIEGMLSISLDHGQEAPPVIQTSAATGAGIPELARAMLQSVSRSKNRTAWATQRIREEILTLMEGRLFCDLVDVCGNNGSLEKAVQKVINRKSDPYTAARELLPKIMHKR